MNRMDDLISRQAAIDALNGGFTVTGRENAETIRDYISGVGKKLRELPSAERHGRWLMTDGYPHKVYCSECYATLIPNVEWFKTYNIASNYCPNCGSRMDLEDEVEE